MRRCIVAVLFAHRNILQPVIMSNARPVRTRHVEMPCQMYDALIPEPLPPPLTLSNDDRAFLSKTEEALRTRTLDEAARDALARTEAAAACRLDGLDVTAETLTSFLETGDVPGDASANDLNEAVGYLDALSLIADRIRTDGDPVTLRLLQDVHQRILSSERGRGKQPGAFRRQQTWVGGDSPVDADFVPPRPGDIMDVMGPLERFVNGVPDELPPLQTAALAYAQLYMTQPFLTANGRVAGLLVPMILVARGVLDDPVLPVSVEIEAHRDAHNDALRQIRTRGDWEGWIQFFTERIADAAARDGT